MKSDRTRRERAKPDFSKKGAIWLDDEFIPQDIESDLREELRPRRWSLAQTDEFMRLLAMGVHQAEESKDLQAQADKKKALQAVEKAAHRLLLALEALNGTEALKELEFNVRYLALVNGGCPPITLSGHSSRIARAGSPVAQWWDVIYDVERAADHTANMVATGKGMRLAQKRTRRLVNAAAGAVRHVTGSLPRTSKGTWFPEFARLLCERFNALPCGVELVAEVVKEMQPPG